MSFANISFQSVAFLLILQTVYFVENNLNFNKVQLISVFVIDHAFSIAFKKTSWKKKEKKKDIMRSKVTYIFSYVIF